jgi:hypothetical protein
VAKECMGDTAYWEKVNEIRPAHREWTKTSIIRTLRLNAATGRPLTQCSCGPFDGAAKRLFGSFEAACRVAGVEAPKKKRGRRRK